jgi:eukaryotic-like serine/threonine-protein kinase
LGSDRANQSLSQQIALNELDGDRIGKYRIIAELGHGGMAEVFLAVAMGPAGFNKLLVIKQLKAELVADPDFVSMFIDEARLAARVNHANIVQTIEVGEDNGRYFIAMEYLDGQAVHRVQHRSSAEGKKIPLSTMLRVLSETLVGLHHAHELRDYDGKALNVVHRDITPHNLFLTYDGQVKIVDFGIAKAANSNHETAAGMLKGKVAYMAPEQVKGEPIDRRADLFSVGVMLWEAVAGRRMWQGLQEVTILHRLFSSDFPKLTDYNPNTPPELLRIITKALQFDRNDRYETAHDFQVELEAYLKTLDDVPTLREIGAFVTEMFETEREELKNIIDTELANISQLASSEIRDVNQVPVWALSTGTHRVITGSRPRRRVGGRGLTSSGVTGSISTATLSQPSEVDLSQGKQRGKTLLAVAGGAVIAVAVFAVVFSMRNKNEKPLPVATSSAPVVIPKDDTKPQLKNVVVSIKASPPTSKITIDGKDIGTNNFYAETPKDDKVHKVIIVADGYETRTENIKFDKDTRVELALRKIETSDSDDKKSKSHPTAIIINRTAPKTNDGNEPGSRKIPPKVGPKQTLDGNNPYEN